MLGDARGGEFVAFYAAFGSDCLALPRSVSTEAVGSLTGAHGVGQAGGLT
jgi:hypothetical protein